MKEQNQESIKLENVILHTGIKLQTIKQENDKFIKVFYIFLIHKKIKIRIKVSI